MKLLLLLLPLYVFSIDLDYTINQIKTHEGFKSKPYVDNGHYSIGYGINLSHVTKAEANLLLTHRLSIRYEQLKAHRWFNNLSPTRQQVILNMTYQLGYSGILKFKKMVWALSHNYYNGAANEMINSRWYRQSGYRAKTLVQQMKTNKRS